MWDPILIGAACMASCALGVWVGQAAARRQLEAKAARADRALAEATELLHRVAAELKEKDARIGGLIIGCTSLEKERNQWKEKFFECGLGYGAAQQMLLVERDGLLRQLIAAKIQPRVDKRVVAVTQNFEERFAQPVREAVALENQGRIEGGEVAEDKPA